jgi:hypothetical protein
MPLLRVANKGKAAMSPLELASSGDACALLLAKTSRRDYSEKFG